MPEYVVITSSGGSGHNVAAECFAAKKRDKDSASVVHVLDVMRSGCSFGSKLGTLMTNLWDEAQQQGDIFRQRRLFVMQPMVEKLFFVSTFLTVLIQLLRCESAPKKVVSVQPLHLSAIVSAVRAANFLKFRQKKIEKIDLCFTDLPSEKAEHFIGALKRLREASQEAFDMIRVCAPDPIEKNGEVSKTFWESHNITHIKRKSLPLSVHFRKPDLLPLPATDQAIHLVNGDTHLVKAKDKVAFVMLGSCPETNAVLNYIDSFITAAKRRKFHEGDPVRYLFISCGKGEDNDLLKVAKKKVREAGLNSHVRVIPFGSQDISSIFARSDLSITRSGGMTSSEINALKNREKDNKRVYIHSPFSTYIVGLDENDVRATLLDSIPLWENGNAEQLMWNPKVQAEVTNPRLSFDVFSQYIF